MVEEPLKVPIPKFSREIYFKFSILVLLFMLLIFDPSMAQIYIAIIIGDFVWAFFDNKISYPLESATSGRILSLVIAVIAAAGFFFISTFVLKSIGSTTTQSIWQLWATSTPILKDNRILTFIGWAILIPVIETSFFFGRVFEGLTLFVSQRFGKRINPYSLSIPMALVIIVISALFTLFHLTAKGLGNQALLLTFIFAMVSCVLVVYTKNLRSAVLLHIFTNSLALLSSFGML